LRPFFNRTLHSTRELPLKETLATAGVEMEVRPAESSADRGGKRPTKTARELAHRVTLGVRTAEDPGGVKLTHVVDGSTAQAAGLSAGDIIAAIGGLRVNAKNFEARLAAYRPGDRVHVHAFRRDELLECTVTLAASPADTCSLAVKAHRSAQKRRLQSWLHD
jgi:predicted metalloprotease with PDZ domain